MWKTLKRMARDNMLSQYILAELKHESATVLKLSLTFVGATLVGRSVWQWIVDYYDTFVAFSAGVVLLFLVAFMRNHKQ